MTPHTNYKSNKIKQVSISKIIEEIIKRTIEKKNLKCILK
jgi:phosphoribosylpyrophosphate synthetase